MSSHNLYSEGRGIWPWTQYHNVLCIPYIWQCLSQNVLQMEFLLLHAFPFTNIRTIWWCSNDKLTVPHWSLFSHSSENSELTIDNLLHYLLHVFFVVAFNIINCMIYLYELSHMTFTMNVLFMELINWNKLTYFSYSAQSSHITWLPNYAV